MLQSSVESSENASSRHDSTVSSANSVSKQLVLTDTMNFQKEYLQYDSVWLDCYSAMLTPYDMLSYSTHQFLSQITRHHVNALQDTVSGKLATGVGASANVLLQSTYKEEILKCTAAVVDLPICHSREYYLYAYPHGTPTLRTMRVPTLPT